ncbi:MAG: S41 family peptidase [Bacteroidia bacterium]|nr:S41 family peptidase [Bacteroidia bacterium]
MTLKKKSGFLEEQEPIKINPDTKWTEYSKILTPGKDDDILAFSIGIDTTVTLLVSDFKLMIKENNTWIPAKIKNGNFENGLNYWQINQINYNISTDSIRSDNGNRCVKIKYANKIPNPGEYITKNIGNDLILKMPIALYNYKGHTFPVADSVKWNSLKRKINNIPTSKLTNENYTVRLANIVIAWNVFQHFFPYFDVLNVDWENELTKTLINTYSINSQSDYYFELMRMTAKLEDAHVSIMGFNAIGNGLKIKVDLFDNDIVVTSSGSELIKKGDIIKSIDGITAFSELKNKEQLISASPNVRRNRALQFFGITMTNKDAEVTLMRDNKEIHLKVTRTPLTDKFYQEDYNSSKIIDCGDSVYYLKGKIQDINSLLKKIVNAKGVIIGSVGQLWDLLPYMIKEPVWSANWLIPINLYPDREKTLWNASSWTIDPKLPFIEAKFAILTTSDDQSNLETVLGIVDYYKLGKLVGDTSAGCNGNVNTIPLNGGYSIRWTGMKVLKHDGSQHHLIGFNPDYPVIRTKDAVLLGIDEYLQTAMKILKTN